MHNKKVLIDALKKLGNAKAPSNKKDIIVDPNGQWAHPGEITRIPSDTITMQGVPYPVLAKPNVGQPQMMYPGQNYQFPDADYVDEYPQMKKGGESPTEFLSAKEGVDTPIYKQVSVKPSKIAGKGLFINEPVKAGEPIGVSHIRKVFDRNGESYQAPFPSTVLGYYNHSKEPNVREVDNGDHIVLIATRDIKPNEELTSNYDISGIQDLETSDNFKKGGSIPKLPKKKNARAYSRSLEATNRLLAEHPFFAQPKSRKNKIYDPNSQYFQDGGAYYDDSRDAWVQADGTVGPNGPAYFQDGGEYMEVELTPEQIQEYAKGGYIIEDISVPELTKANLGKIVKTSGNALSKVSKAPTSSGWVRGTTTLVPRIPPTKLNLGSIPADFPANVTFPLDIYNKDNSGYLTLYPNPKVKGVDDNTWHFLAKMPNAMEAGRAFQLMNQAITKPNPSILEPYSLSLDSYNMLLNMGKRPDWEMAYENHLPLNYMSVNHNLFEGLEVPKGMRTGRFLKQETADEMVKRLNDMLLQRGMTEQAKVVSIPGGPLKEIHIPNYKLTRQYAEGGYLPEASMGLIVPKAGQLARTGVYKGLNPAGYGILDKVKGLPSELYSNTVNNSTRPFRVGMSLKYGHPEHLETFLKTKRVPLEDFKKMSDADKMQLFDSTTLHTLNDIGRRRLDAWAVGLGLPQEYSTLEQIGDDKFRMLNTEYTPEYFNELYNDLRASGYENTLTAGYNPLEGLSREFYRTKLQNRLATQKDIDAEMTLQDQMRTFGWNAWNRSRNAKLNPASFSGIDTGSVWDNDPYGVMGGYRWDIDQHPQGLQFTTSDMWDLNPFEKRGSAFLNVSDLSKKALESSYFKPLQNLEALKLVGGKPFLIENNFVIDPKTYNTLDKWEDGGNMDYTLGDEVDEATMKELEKLGYTFEKI